MYISEIGRWIAENEALLSGMAALVVLAGVIFSPLGRGVRRLFARLGLVEFWATTGKWSDCADEVPYDFKAECRKAQHIPKEDFGP